MDNLMAEIRALGHIPRASQRDGAEKALYMRCHYAKVNSLLSEAQLAELAEIARSSDEPVRTVHKRLRESRCANLWASWTAVLLSCSVLIYPRSFERRGPESAGGGSAFGGSRSLSRGEGLEVFTPW